MPFLSGGIARAAASRETDDGGESRRRIGASATLAKPPADMPTAIMPSVVTSVRRFIAAIAARRSSELVLGRYRKLARSQQLFWNRSAGIAITAPHHHECRKTPARKFDRLPIKPVRGHPQSLPRIGRGAVTEPGEGIALGPRRPYQQCFKSARAGLRHRDPQGLLIIVVGGGRL